jgi:hypothetical protein
MSAMNNFIKYLSVGTVLFPWFSPCTIADETAKPEFHLISTISATATVWHVGMPLLLVVQIQNQGTNDVQFPKPFENVGKLHVFASSSDQKTLGQLSEALFKFIDEGGSSQLPYIELVAGGHTNLSLLVGLPDSVIHKNVTEPRTVTCNVQVELEFDLASANMLPGHVVFRNTLPEKLGEAAHVKSDAEVAAEVQRYKQSGVPVWDFGRLWRGKIFSNTISLSCQK